MDLLAIMQKIWRYKLATLPVIVLTVVGLAYATVLKPKVYQAQASYLLVNPPGAPTTQQIAQNRALAKLHWDNPYVRFGDLSVVVQLLARAMSTDTMQRQLLAQGVQPNYVVGPSVQFGVAPIFQIAASGPSPSAAVRSASIVSNATRQLFDKLQASQGVSRQFWITTLPLENPDHAQLQVSSFLRTVVAILAAGVITLFIVLSVVAGLDERRSLRHWDVAEHDSLEALVGIATSGVQSAKASGAAPVTDGAPTANGASRRGVARKRFFARSSRTTSEL